MIDSSINSNPRNEPILVPNSWRRVSIIPNINYELPSPENPWKKGFKSTLGMFLGQITSQLTSQLPTEILEPLEIHTTYTNKGKINDFIIGGNKINLEV